MKVRHLIEELQAMDPEAEVRMESYYGDRVGTLVASPIYRAEVATIEWDSEWPNGGRCTVVKNGDADGPTGSCVLLRYFDEDEDGPEWAQEEEE